MWPFKKKRPEQWAKPKMYTIFLNGKPPMQFPSEHDIIALHRQAVGSKDPLFTVPDEEGNPSFQCKTELVEVIIMGFAQQEEPNARKKQLQP